MVSYLSTLLNQARRYFTGDIPASSASLEGASNKPIHINSSIEFI